MIEDLFTPMHLAVLFAIIFFLFGAKRLPELGKSLGHGIREFRSGIAGAADTTLEQIAVESAPPAVGDVPPDADVIDGEAHEVPADAGEDRAAV